MLPDTESVPPCDTRLATGASPSFSSTLSATGAIVAGRAMLSTHGFAEPPLEALALALASEPLPYNVSAALLLLLAAKLMVSTPGLLE